MTPPTPPTICPMFETQNCRFFSQEHMIITYAPLVEDPRSKRLIAGSVCHKKEPLGNYCNNASIWVSELTYCPARWALHGVASNGCVADGCGTYTEPVKVASVLFRED